MHAQIGSSDIGPLEYARNHGEQVLDLESVGVEDVFSGIHPPCSCLRKVRCLELLIAFLSSSSFNYVAGISVGGDLW